ncbi:uncharacterized protein LOC120339427 [Styela clava]|uniref:uncharacterized protein LOC120339427 n=1 Tax=Styela clava TaxID=7725 RepID=UPI00193ACF39|nr:uncharacterized protein LOC120339427 [Styela clava]
MEVEKRHSVSRALIFDTPAEPLTPIISISKKVPDSSIMENMSNFWTPIRGELDNICGLPRKTSTVNPLWLQSTETTSAKSNSTGASQSDEAGVEQPRKKRKYTKRKKTYNSAIQYDGGNILPDHLADFILEEEADNVTRKISDHEYEMCLHWLTSSVCRKSQMSKVCKILGFLRTPASRKPKRKYRKRNMITLTSVDKTNFPYSTANAHSTPAQAEISFTDINSATKSSAMFSEHSICI